MEVQKMEELRALLSLKGQYHNHKETMAHAALLIQIGILGLLIKMDSLASLSCCCKILVVVGYVAMWAIISWYMYWQLGNRQTAAEQVNELIEAIKDQCKNDKWLAVINNMRDKKEGPKKGQHILWVADVFILIVVLFRMLWTC